jgi:ketosteroid isomerase-like protein
MTAGDVEIVRRGYDAFNRGDVGAVLEVLDPQVVWHAPPILPESGTFHGREEVRRWLESYGDAWEETRVDVEDIREEGDRVVAQVRVSGRGRGSGVPVSGNSDLHVWRVRDGLVYSVRMYQGMRDALEAEGLTR